MAKQHLDVYNTHIELYPYEKDDYPALENDFTAEDKMTGEHFPCGYMIHEGKMYLARGASVSKIEYLIGTKAHYETDPDEYSEMRRKHYAIFEPRDDLQAESIKFLCESGPQAGLLLRTGFGKGHPYSELIPTPTNDGYTQVGDLKVGDYVFGSDGFPTMVTDIFELGITDTYKVTFSDKRNALVTDEHLWAVRQNSNEEYRVLSTKELLGIYNSENAVKYNIPLCGAVEYPYQNIPINPYILGRIIAKISDDECYGKNIIKILQDTDVSFGTLKYIFGNDDMFLNEIYIPDIYIFNSFSVRLDLMRGILDISGNIINVTDSACITFHSQSVTLLTQLQKLMYSFGYTADINYSLNYISLKASVSFLKCLFRDTHSWFKMSNMINDYDRDKSLTIEKIEKVGEAKSRCIKVNNPDHLYLTRDFIVTHNTFCVSYAITKLNEKALIIAPNDSIKNQWIKTFTTMFDYRPDDIINISGSQIINAIVDGEMKAADIYIVNHQTLRSYLSSTNPYQFHEFFRKIRVGIKVYDEAHLNYENTLLIDFFSNTNRTWYLTATFDRSSKSESACFKRAFSTVVTFGEKESREVSEKHVIYHIVNIDSRITPQNRGRVFKYPGFSAAHYGDYAIFYDENNTLYKTILSILEKTKNIEGKTLIFLPTIAAVDEVVKRLKKDFTSSVAAYHSKVAKDEKESAEKKKIIVSTIKSCGTGKDIKGLRSIICAEPVASKVLIEQTIGRLRPYAKDKATYYWDIVDISIAPNVWWHVSRMKRIQMLVKEIVHLNV